MSETVILIINVFLVTAGFFALGSAFWNLYRGTVKPIRTGLEAIITVLFFGLAITSWNTHIPVVLWWFMAAGASLLAGATVISAVKVPEAGRR